MSNGEPKPGLTPAGWIVMLLVIGALGYGGYFLMTSRQNAQPPANGGQGGGSSGGGGGQPSGSGGGSGGSSGGGATETPGGEAPDTNSVTTVKEYTYVPASKLPPVKGTSNYVWNEQEKIVNFSLNVWSGWLPIYAANHGAKPNTDSIFYKKYGFKVDLQLIDDPVGARDAFAAGRVHVLWGTLDMMVLFSEGLLKDSRTAPRIYQQIDWSNGGDGIVVRSNIRTVKDLIGKSVVCAENSPSQYYITSLLINSGIQPTQVNFKYTATAFEAAAAFVADKSLAGCVSWAPDIYKIPEQVAGTRILSSTLDANKLIADVWAVRADFAKDHPDVVKGLVAGIFEGMREVKKNPGPACQWMADAFGMSAEDIHGMMADAHATNFAENKEFFLNQNNPANFERTWKSISFVYKELRKIDVPIPFDNIMDFSVLKALDQEGLFRDLRAETRSRHGHPDPGDPVRPERGGHPRARGPDGRTVRGRGHRHHGSHRFLDEGEGRQERRDRSVEPSGAGGHEGAGREVQVRSEEVRRRREGLG
ncbi:MAG: ABC transporter substrate-binding protein [Planctomycetes bacterium]|nr:ABC transporter substrate-binding protein [Planctomycetota bacterium]